MYRYSLQAALVALAALQVASCGGSSASNPDQEPNANDNQVFEVIGDPVPPALSWQLNRPIEIHFSKEIDFSRLSLSITELQTGFGATGEFEPGTDPVSGAQDLRIVRFVPSCPTELDGTGAGFVPGTLYQLKVHGQDSSSAPMFALDGTPLQTSWVGEFGTAEGTDPSVLFWDGVAGAPRPVIRGRSSAAGPE